VCERKQARNSVNYERRYQLHLQKTVARYRVASRRAGSFESKDLIRGRPVEFSSFSSFSLYSVRVDDIAHRGCAHVARHPREEP